MSLKFGSKGPRGYVGNQGDAGAQGDTGDTGAAGADGVGNFVDRGDAVTFDFDIDDFTEDNNFYDLDLSGIVGAARRLVLVHIELRSTSTSQRAYFRENGVDHNYNRSSVMTPAANVTITADIWVYTDAAGVIEYKVSHSDVDQLNFVVRGWFVLL